MRTDITVLTTFAIGFLSTPGCQRDTGVKSVPAVKASAHMPQMFVDFNGGMPADVTLRSSGVRLAVWEDGSVLFGVDPMNPEKEMRVGQLSPAALDAAWKAVRESGMTTHPDISHVVPDASSVQVVIRVDGRTHTHWLSDHRWAGVDWWPKAEDALTKFRPATSQPVAEVATDGMYRGYNVKEWWLTSWRR